MSRLLHEACRVTLARTTAQLSQQQIAPQRFRWRHTNYRVESVLLFWLSSGPWWRSGQVQEQPWWRVLATSFSGETGIYELTRQPENDNWWLMRVWD